MDTDNDLLDDLVKRILEVIQARRIILFGSAARGEAGAESDLDVLVVVPEDADHKHIAGAIYKSLIGFAAAVDVVIATEEDLQRYGDNPSLIYRPALREGRELYAA